MSYSKTNWQDLPSLDTPVNATRLNKIENGIADAHGAIGVDSYSASSTYEVGDYCIYNNKMYKCNTAISTAEAFNSSKWTEVTIPSELIDKGSVVSATEPTGNNRAKIWFKKGTNIQNQIYVKNNSNQYETFANTGAFEKEVTDARGTFNNLDSRIDSIETEVTNARGSFSSLDDRLDDIETEIAEDTITGEGENITLNGTAQNAMKKLVIKGKTEQEQLTGKNKINEPKATWDNYLATNTINSDGSITVTATSANKYAAASKVVCACEQGETYTISLKAISVATANPNVRLGKNNSAVGNIIGYGESVLVNGVYKITKTFTADENFDLFVSLYPKYDTDVIGSAKFYDFQVELGSTVTSYEPYCRRNTKP